MRKEEWKAPPKSAAFHSPLILGLGKEVQAISPPSFYEAYRALTRLRDCWKTLPDETIDRYFDGVIQKFLQAYHELEGKESQRETPWQ